MGAAPGSPRYFGMYGYSAMFGAPNIWRLDSSGTLTKELETEEFKQAIGYMRDLWTTACSADSPATTRVDGFVPGNSPPTSRASATPGTISGARACN